MATTGTFLKPIFIAGTSYPVGAATIDDALVSQLPRDTFVPTTEPNPNVDNRTPAQLIAAHNASAPAHGFGSYTVAQLNAFTDANRPTGVVYCTDCLTPEGTGSGAFWSGTSWLCTCSAFPVTSDLLTYFREARKRGHEIDTEKQFSAMVRPNAMGGTYSVTSGTGALVAAGYDLGTLIYTTGTTTTGYSSAAVGNYGIQSTIRYSGAVRQIEVAMYYAVDCYVSALSTATDEFAVVAGFLDVGSANTIGTSLIGLAYDRGNVLGLANTTNSANWFGVARASSVNTTTNLGAAPGVGRANVARLEVLKVGALVTYYLNGTLAGSITTNIPSANLQPRTLIVKSAGTTSRNAGVHREYFAVRF